MNPTSTSTARESFPLEERELIDHRPSRPHPELQSHDVARASAASHFSPIASSSSQRNALLETRALAELNVIGEHVIAARKILNVFAEKSQQATEKENEEECYFSIDHENNIYLQPSSSDSIEAHARAKQSFIINCIQFYGNNALNSLNPPINNNPRLPLTPLEVRRILSSLHQLVSQVTESINENPESFINRACEENTLSPLTAQETESPEEHLCRAIAHTMTGLASITLPAALTGVVATVPLGIPHLAAAMIFTIPCIASTLALGMSSQSSSLLTSEGRNLLRQQMPPPFAGIGATAGTIVGGGTPLFHAPLAPHLGSAPLITLGFAKGLGVLLGGMVLGAGAGALWFGIMAGAPIYAITHLADTSENLASAAQEFQRQSNNWIPVGRRAL